MSIETGGNYDKTEDIKSIQAKVGAKVDGKYGPETKAKMEEYDKRATSTGETNGSIEDKGPTDPDIPSKSDIETFGEVKTCDSRDLLESSADTFDYIKNLRKSKTGNLNYLDDRSKGHWSPTSIDEINDIITIRNYKEREDNYGKHDCQEVQYTLNPRGGRNFEVSIYKKNPEDTEKNNDNQRESRKITIERGNMTNEEFNKNVLPKIENRIQEREKEIEEKKTKSKNKAIEYSSLQDQKRLTELEQQIDQLS